MTVDEFIAALQALPPEARRNPLMIEGLDPEHDRYRDIEGVDERTVPIRVNKDGVYKSIQIVVIE